MPVFHISGHQFFTCLTQPEHKSQSRGLLLPITSYRELFLLNLITLSYRAIHSLTSTQMGHFPTDDFHFLKVHGTKMCSTQWSGPAPHLNIHWATASKIPPPCPCQTLLIPSFHQHLLYHELAPGPVNSHGLSEKK